ncbi:MAG: hypothetical protein AAB723_00665 [Patescibacteria group bacterium]
MFSKEKWQKMSLRQKMGNLASEVAKSFYWKNKDKKTADETAQRALELFDLTADDLVKNAGLGEILKLRSIFCDTFFNLGQFNNSEQAINNYFSPFL